METIKLLMKGRKMRALDLSLASGVSIYTLTKILQGRTINPRLSTMKAITNALGCSLDVFADIKKLKPDQDEEYLQVLRKRPEIKALLDLLKNAPTGDVVKVSKVIELFSNKAS